MLTYRVIPVLLLKNHGLVKTMRFKEPRYVGDPINAIKIFDEKEVDELVVLDIGASLESREPAYRTINEVASECFMPFCYGGGVRDVAAMERIFSLGAEKVAINSEAFVNLDLIRQAARRFGSQSIVGSVDVKKNMLGRYEVWVRGGTVNAHLNPVEYAQKLEDAGAGELFLNSIDRDGTMMGYDLALIRSVTRAVRIPVVAIGGAGSVDDLVAAVHEGGASAAGAGAMFVFHGKHRAVLITYPDRDLLNQKLHSCS